MIHQWLKNSWTDFTVHFLSEIKQGEFHPKNDNFQRMMQSTEIWIAATRIKICSRCSAVLCIWKFQFSWLNLESHRVFTRRIPTQPRIMNLGVKIKHTFLHIVSGGMCCSQELCWLCLHWCEWAVAVSGHKQLFFPSQLPASYPVSTKSRCYPPQELHWGYKAFILSEPKQSLCFKQSQGHLWWTTHAIGNPHSNTKPWRQKNVMEVDLSSFKPSFFHHSKAPA